MNYGSHPMSRRRTVQDLLTQYRRAKARRSPDENELALELGSTLAKTGTVAEFGTDNLAVKLWQPVPTEGGPPGFAISDRFKNAAAVAAPKYRPQLAAARP